MGVFYILLYSEFITNDVEFIDDLLIFFHNFFEFFYTVHYCGMIASREDISDTFIGVMEFIFEKIHRDLSWNHIFFFAIFREKSTDFDTKVTRYGLYEVFVATVCRTNTL